MHHPPQGGIVQWEQACRPSAGVEEMRTVLARSSVPHPNVTKSAAIGTRSIAVQTEDPAWGGISLWDWLTPTAVNPTATRVSEPGVDGRSLQQWRSIQGKHGLELEKVQHSIQQNLEQCRDPGRKPRARSPAAMLEQMKDRIRSSSQDMHFFFWEGAAERRWCGLP